MGLFRRNKVWWMTFIHQGQQVRRSTGTTDKRLAEAILGKVRVKIVEADSLTRWKRKTIRSTT